VAAAYAPYRALADPEVPTRSTSSTPVIARAASDRMAAFMRSWEETYLAWLSEEPFLAASDASRGGRADQLAFRRCAWQHGVRLFVLAPEYNFRADYPTMVRERVRVIHGRHDDYEALAARINDQQRARTWPRPLPLGARVVRRIRKTARVGRPGADRL
jgi:hypothetical protein